MLNRTYFTVPLAALALCITSQAVADVAPPATYVEQCTVEKQSTKSNECIACKAIRFGDGLGRCEKLLAPYCYSKVCDSWGGTVYTEVFCRVKAENPVVVPPSIISQLNGYEAPKLDPSVGGAANCPSAPTQDTPTQDTPTQDLTTNDLLDEIGCSVSGSPNIAGKSLGVLGLLGLMLVMNRRKTLRNR